MSNSIAVGRRLAARIVFSQIGAAVLVALLFLVQGPRFALAALGAGIAVALGNALLALRLFATIHAKPGQAFARLIAGTALKWMVSIGGMYVVIMVLRLPPLPALCGFIAALIAQVAGLRFKVN